MKAKSDLNDQVVGAVLTGGASRRMGRDKALVEVGGRSLLVRAAAVLRGVFQDVVVVGKRYEQDVAGSMPMLPDLRPGLGPVAGIHAALIHAYPRAVFILACDLPLVTSEFVGWIAGPALSGTEPAAHLGQPLSPAARVPRDRKGAQPLCGLYTNRCLPAVEEALDQSRLSAQELLARLDTEYLDIGEESAGQHLDLLTNVNAPQDLVNLAAALETEP